MTYSRWSSIMRLRKRHHERENSHKGMNKSAKRIIMNYGH